MIKNTVTWLVATRHSFFLSSIAENTPLVASSWMMCLNHVTMKSESCILFGTTCSTTHIGSCMPSISVLVLIGAQNVETALDLLGIRYIHQMHTDGDIKDVAKSAVKCFWASIATRTKKAAALVRQSEHAVRYFRDASMPNGGTEITGTFGYHADIFRTQAGGRYPWLLRTSPSSSRRPGGVRRQWDHVFHPFSCCRPAVSLENCASKSQNLPLRVRPARFFIWLGWNHANTSLYSIYIYRYSIIMHNSYMRY